MPGGVIFEFKCAKGHRTEKVFPPRTPYADYDQIACPECLKAGELKDAYLVFSCPEPPEKKGNAGSRP